MKTITITIDLKSIGLGALCVLGIGLLSNFNNANKAPINAADEGRRYQAVSSDRGFIIVDTQTGQYLLDTRYAGRPQWVKGDFTTIYDDRTRKTD